MNNSNLLNKKVKYDKKLLSNTFFLYLLTFSTHLFSLATVPYLTRILGASIYGKIGIAMAYMSYVAIIMDFGFILSATQKVVEHKMDKYYLGRLLSSITLAKVLLGIIVSVIFLVYVSNNTNMKVDFNFYMYYLIAYILNALTPDFYYRGIEKMKVITYRTLAIKAFFMCMIFLFVKQSSDFWKVPIFNILGNLFAVIFMYTDIYIKYGIKMKKVSINEFRLHIRDTIPFFVSRIASTTYQALNTIILSFIYGASSLIGCYTSTDKIISLSKTGASPIADSLYPYMLREKNFKLVRKLLKIAMPVIFLGAVFLYIFADSICVFLFGAEFIESGKILRCLLPIMIVILPTYVLCFPVMVPMGLSKQANRSNVIGMITQIFGLVILWISGQLNIYSLCILTSTTEVIVFLYRAIVVFINRDKMKLENK